jgi:nucleoside phosphorylase
MPNNTHNLKTLILVPQGAEYQAVAKNFKHDLNFLVCPIPIGCSSVSKYLESLKNPQQFSQAIAMGLCGSLNPDLKVGDVVVYEECLYQEKVLKCTSIPKVINSSTQVKAVTSDRLIYLASEKQNLCKTTNCDVVDMEGYIILEFFSKLNIPVGTIRVVSDDSDRDLPNLEQAIDVNGKLKPLKLAIAFIKQPIAALRLIQGSLKSLQVLSEVSSILKLKKN